MKVYTNRLALVSAFVRIPPMMTNEQQKQLLWNRLQQHKLADAQLFSTAPGYFSSSPIDTVEAAGLTAHFARHRLDQSVWSDLLGVLVHSDFEAMRKAYFSGEPINNTENRAVLHTALRRPLEEPLFVDGCDMMNEVRQLHRQMSNIVDGLEQGTVRGRDGQSITDIIHIGIGGSDLGPVMVHSALPSFVNPDINVHFLANIDMDMTRSCLANIDPGRALVIVVSKSFTTFETLTNARMVRQWMRDAQLSHAYCSQHFYAVTSQVDAAIEFGIAPSHILPMWDSVGGRFSVWSGVSLSIAMVLGMDNFQQFLAGAYAMDEHFKSAPLPSNMPVILGLLGVWYGNFLQAQTQVILPYTDKLVYFPNFLQQLHMESLGKSVTKSGSASAHTTGRVLWGGVGTNSQHSFHQLLMQGTHLTPVDFILPMFSDNGERNDQLIAHCLAQAEVLWNGTQKNDNSSSSDDFLTNHRLIFGGRPSTVILTKRLTPFSLGALVSLYEHKVFVQSLVWGVNAFDQWGVEHGKRIASQLMSQLVAGSGCKGVDPLTAQILGFLHREV